MLEKVNLLTEANKVDRLYVYEKVGNGHTLSIVNVENRKLEFHVHEDSNEFIEGNFELETRDGLTKVNAGEFIIVPKGILQRPAITSSTRVLLIELD